MVVFSVLVFVYKYLFSVCYLVFDRVHKSEDQS